MSLCAVRPRPLPLLAGAFVLIATRVAWAQPAPDHPHPTARLEYAHAAGTERCPDETAVRAAVARRLGYDPFAPEASTVVRAGITRRGRGLRVRIALERATGVPPSPRTIDARGTDCVELARAMTLAISIAIDPLVVTRPAPPPEPATTPENGAGTSSGTTSGASGGSASSGTAGGGTVATTATSVSASATNAAGSSSSGQAATTAASPPPNGASGPRANPTSSTRTPPARNAAAARRAAAPATRPRPDAWHARLGLGIDIGTGLHTRGVSGGALLHGGARWRNLSLALELRTALPAAETPQPALGTINTLPFSATVLVCGHEVPVRFVFFCAAVSATALVGYGTGDQLTRALTRVVGPLFGLGGRLGLEFPIGRVVILRVYGEGAWVPTVATLTIVDQTRMPAVSQTYTNPVFAVAGGVGALFHFP